MSSTLRPLLIAPRTCSLISGALPSAAPGIAPAPFSSYVLKRHHEFVRTLEGVVDIFCTKHFAAQFEATVEHVAHRFSVIFAHFLLHLVKGKVSEITLQATRDFLENITVDWSGGEHRRGARSAY